MDTEKQLSVVASYDFTDGGWPWQIQVADEDGETRRYSTVIYDEESIKTLPTEWVDAAHAVQSQDDRIRSLDSANQALRRLNDRLKTRNDELVKIIDMMLTDYLECAGDLYSFESNDYHALEDYNLNVPVLKRIENRYHGIKIRGYLNHLKELGIDL
jgi:hypothetical protein